MLAPFTGCNPSAPGQPDGTDNENAQDDNVNDNSGDNANVNTNDNGAGGAGTTFYVSTTGSDNANGLTTQTAVATIAGAVALASPGDTVAVMPGTYLESLMM